MPRSTETLSRLQFYVLHQEIVAQCQAWLQEKANLSLMDDTEPLFYGFANGEPGLSEKVSKYRNRSIKYACISILRKKGFDFGAHGFRVSRRDDETILFHGRHLKDLVHSYNKGTESIEMGQKYFLAYREMAGNPEMEALIEKYRSRQSGAEEFPPRLILPTPTSRPPKRSKSDKAHSPAPGRPTNTPKTKPPGSRPIWAHTSRTYRTLKWLSENSWYLYNCDYDNYRVIRRVLEVHLPPGEWWASKIRISSPEGRSTFEGEVNWEASEEELLVLSLFNQDQTRYMHLRLKIPAEAPGSLFLGQYMITRFHAIVSRTCMLEKMAQDTEGQPKEFEKEAGELPEFVRSFFRNERGNLLKTPRSVYNETSFWKRLGGELKEAQVPPPAPSPPEKEYDLFVSAPVLSTKLQRDILEDALGELMQSLQAQFPAGPADIAAFEPAARKVLEKWMLGDKAGVPFINFEVFNREVIKFLDQLVAQFPLISNYYYSWPKKDPSSKTSRSPKIVLIEEYKIMQRSRAFLLIVPNNRLFSSCWVQVGWAIMLEIPIFIIYRDEYDLPFILQKADSLHYNIEMHQLRPGEKLISTIDWFRDNGFGQKFFS